MLENLNRNLINSDVTGTGANPLINLPIKNDEASHDDIEVIDLDDIRGQIKPTTWHQ